MRSLFSSIPFFALSLTAACAVAQAPLAPSASSAQFVDALNGVFGKHRGMRANHAKGIVLTGSFTPAAEAASVTSAPHFQRTAVPATIRFSSFGGNADVPDAHAMASPRGLSVKFHLPDGSETDLVSHSFNGFPSRTSDEFRAFVLAMGASGPGAMRPTALDVYAASNERAKFFLESPKPPPVSFGSLPYFGVNTFKFTNAQGVVAFGRYRFMPVDAIRYLSAESAAMAAPDYLHQEMLARIGRRPLEFKLMLQKAEDGDRIDDPSIAWPDTRRLVALGTLTITALDADSADAQDALLFLPADVPAGIETADPMLDVRTKAYSESFERRQR